MESPLSFLQIEASFIMLLILAITIVDYLIKKWTEYKTIMQFETPATIVNNNKYYSAAHLPNWMYMEDCVLDSQTPIQRIRGMRYLRLEQRVRIMTGVRRRLDQQF